MFAVIGLVVLLAAVFLYLGSLSVWTFVYKTALLATWVIAGCFGLGFVIRRLVVHQTSGERRSLTASAAAAGRRP